MIKKIMGTIMIGAGMLSIYTVINSRIKHDIKTSQLQVNKEIDKIVSRQNETDKVTEYTSSRVDNIENDIEDIQRVINSKVLNIDEYR